MFERDVIGITDVDLKSLAQQQLLNLVLKAAGKQFKTAGNKRLETRKAVERDSFIIDNHGKQLSGLVMFVKWMK